MITRLGTKVGDCDEMRLRSGHRVGVDGPAAKIPQTAAEARAMLMKDAVKMPDEHVLAFKQGLAGLLNRWTALQLAITNEWGGAESVQKGEAMREELEDWFLKRRGGKYAEDLEELLAEILGDDFCVQCEDGSPREVAHVACVMFEQTAAGDYTMGREICAKPLPREHLERSKRIEEDRRWTMGAGGNGNANGDDGSQSCSSDEDEEAEMMDADALADGLAAAFNAGQGVGGTHGGDDDAARATRRGHTDPDEDGWSTVTR
jgi:pre-rRNA-processing protein TSR2